MNAETLLWFTLGCDRAYLYAHPERNLTADETAGLRQPQLAERIRGVRGAVHHGSPGILGYGSYRLSGGTDSAPGD